MKRFFKYVWRKFKFGIILALLAFAFIVFYRLAIYKPHKQKLESAQGKITRVHDGDTFTSSNHQYRLFAIDTPELSSLVKGHWENTSGLEQIYAMKATVEARKLLLGRVVNILTLPDVTYGRYVARVVLANGVDFGISMVKMGLARVGYVSLNRNSKYFTSDSSYYYKLKNAEDYASANSIGFWKENVKKVFALKPIITN